MKWSSVRHLWIARRTVRFRCKWRWCREASRPDPDSQGRGQDSPRTGRSGRGYLTQPRRTRQRQGWSFTDAEDVRSVKAVPGIDVVVGGHPHVPLDAAIIVNDRSAVVQAGSPANTSANRPSLRTATICGYSPTHCTRSTTPLPVTKGLWQRSKNRRQP